MAISSLQKLSSQSHRLPSLSYSATRSSATSVAPSAASTSQKVVDRIVKLSAIDLNDKKCEFIGLSGQTLLRALANQGLIDPASHRLKEIDACSYEKLPPRSYDEEYLLKRNSRDHVLNKHSRLDYQVILTPQLQGMVVAIPEPKP